MNINLREKTMNILDCHCVDKTMLGHRGVHNSIASAQCFLDPVHHETVPSPHKHIEKSDPQDQFAKVADAAAYFQSALQNINVHLREVERLRTAARDMYGRTREARVLLTAISGQVLPHLSGKAAGKGEQRLAVWISEMMSVLKQTEEQEIASHGISEELLFAEWKLKQVETSLDEKFVSPHGPSRLEVGMLREAGSAALDKAEDESTEHTVDDSTIVRPLSAIQLGTTRREEILMPLEFMHLETVQGISRQALTLGPGKDSRQRDKASDDTSNFGEIPTYMETLVTCTTGLEYRPMAAVADRLSRLLARKSHVRSRMYMAQADYAILWEDAQRRVAVGVNPDSLSQQYLDDYPHICNLQQEELADVDAEIAVCEQLIDRRVQQIPLVSQAFFHMHQFTEFSTDFRPTELFIDDENDWEKAQWGMYEALARDLWPVSGSIPYPKDLGDWMSMTPTIIPTYSDSRHYYRWSWMIKCLQASWLSYSRFIYYNYLDDVVTHDLQSIGECLGRSWIESDFTINACRAQDKQAERRCLSVVPTASIEFNTEKTEKVTRSGWSVGAQGKTTLTSRMSTASKAQGASRRVTRSRSI